jgi:hypothetical protein
MDRGVIFEGACKMENLGKPAPHGAPPAPPELPKK